MALLGEHPVAAAVGVLTAAYLIRFFYHLVQWRRRFRNLVSMRWSACITSAFVQSEAPGTQPNGDSSYALTIAAASE